MPATALPSYRTLAAPAETYMTFWRGMFQASSDATLWWTRRWLDAPTTFLNWSPLAYAAPVAPSPKSAPHSAPQPAPKTAAAVIDLAQAAAARAAAEVADQAAKVVEVAETVADVQLSVAEDVASVAVTAAEVLEPQDLTRLVGIGPKLAAALAERGVSRFAQIAGWTVDDLAEIDRALDLKGRAVRDAWVAQAKRLAAEAA